MAVFLLFAGIVGLGFRDAWWSYASRTEPDNRKLWALALGFASAWIIAIIYAIIICTWAGKSFGFGKAECAKLIAIAAATAVAWPAAFIAILTAVGAARASFLDWGCVPLFAILATWLFDPQDLRHFWVFPSPGLLLIVCLAVTLTGTGLILCSLRGPLSDAAFWPHKSRRISVFLGVGCALVSSGAGYLSSQLSSDMVKAGVPAAVVLAIKLALLCPLVLIMSYVQGNRDFRAGSAFIRRSMVFGLLLVVPLLALYESFRQGEIAAVAGFVMATIPVIVFGFEVMVFRVRSARNIRWIEYVGMLLIVLSAVLFSVIQRFI
jgi:hypothetical protein